MKRIIVFLFACIILCSCCRHSGHTPEQCESNDTITSIVERKSSYISFDIVLQMPKTDNTVTLRNIHTNEKRKIFNTSYYNKFEKGDTVFEITHHCPYYVKIVKK